MKKAFYITYSSAQQATQVLAITTQTEYQKNYKQDPRLPACPNEVYANEWQSWLTFLGKPIKEFYPTLADARQAAQALAITTRDEYQKYYKQDPRLPASPNEVYASEWQSWPTFLGKPIKEFYPTLTDAQQAAQALAITTRAGYQKHYKQDPRLPASPNEVYASEWQSWLTFLGKPIKEFYPPLADAQQAAQALAITTCAEYQKHYKKDPRLPACPNEFYASEWQNWSTFLLPEKITNLKVLKQACKVLDINNSRQYRQMQKNYKQLPSKPDNKFDDWIDWYHALDIPRPYPYEKLRSIVIKHKCKTLRDYQKLRTELNDPHIPASPEEVYKNSGWTNSYDLFGTTRPYQVKYFDPEWKEWADSIVEFLKSAKGGDTKAKDLCEFVREYIEPNGFEASPLEYLTRGRTNIQPMLELFEKVPITRKKKWLFSINEFLNWIIANCLILEDIETGEMTPIKGASNPFSHINFDGEQAPQTINETNKLALPYQFVKSGREWVFPPSSTENNASYSEHHHLQRFSADWIPIDDTGLIDSSDPDCVTKVEGGKTFLWNPIYWTYTYALMQLPARGRQIVYCDSGEADAEVADFKNGKIIWKRNRNRLAGLTQQQSMISKTKDNDFGVYYTSNKTNFNGKVTLSHLCP